MSQNTKSIIKRLVISVKKELLPY